MLTYDLDNRGEDPLYVHLYKCMKKDIETKAIQPHEKLPSKRSLARNLGVGLVTVESAYAQLVAEGYLYTEPRRGYFACDIPSHEYAQEAVAKSHPCTLLQPASPCVKNPNEIRDAVATGNHVSTGNFTSYSKKKSELYTVSSKIRFNLASIDISPDAFPFSTWAKTLRDTLSLEPKSSLLSAQDPQGTLRLRCAIASHVRSTRGFAADPSCIVVGAGAQVLYNLIIQLLGRPHTVALENPGYLRLARIYEANGIAISPTPLDSQGISMEGLRASHADIAHITPSHQFPTGVVMPASRRYELLAWATEKPGRYIVEDDYDCEFRLAGKPVSTLFGIDRTERVIYTNTFAKTLGSAFRVAYMVLPEHLAQAYRERMGFYSCTVPAIDQLALARFIEQGDLDRHVNRTKTRCKAVRNTLIDALQKTPAGPFLTFENIDSGLHFIMHVKLPEEALRVEPSLQSDKNRPAALERKIVDSLARQDVAITALSSYKIKDDIESDECQCRLVVSYAELAQDDAKPAAEAISRALAPFTLPRKK